MSLRAPEPGAEGDAVGMGLPQRVWARATDDLLAADEPRGAFIETDFAAEVLDFENSDAIGLEKDGVHFVALEANIADENMETWLTLKPCFEAGKEVFEGLVLMGVVEASGEIGYEWHRQVLGSMAF